MVIALALVAALVAQGPPAPPTPSSGPATTTPTPTTPTSPWQTECRTLVDKGDAEVAVDCLRQAGHSDADDAALALALADVVARAWLREPVLAQPVRAPAPGFDLGDFAWSGKAEVAGLGFADGVIVGSLAAAFVGSTGYNNQSLVLLPFLGGVAGGGAGLAAMIVLGPQLSAGDVHLLRASLIVANYEAINVGIGLATLQASPTVTSGAALMAMVGTVGAAAAGAALVDVDPSAPSLALSFGWVGGTTAVLGLLASDALEQQPQDQRNTQTVLVVSALGSHLGMAAGLGAAPALGLSRTSILLVDAGAVVGLLGGAALAFGFNAPNPLLGYGTIATTTVVGAAAGVVGASFAPEVADQLWPVQTGPTVVVGDRGPAPGVGLVVALP